MRSFFISCQKASELIDAKTYTKLSLWEQYQLQVHVSICKTCNRYKLQSGLIEKMLRSKFAFTDESQGLHLLPNHVKKNIIKKLKKLKNI